MRKYIVNWHELLCHFLLETTFHYKVGKFVRNERQEVSAIEKLVFITQIFFVFNVLTASDYKLDASKHSALLEPISSDL